MKILPKANALTAGIGLLLAGLLPAQGGTFDPQVGFGANDAIFFSSDQIQGWGTGVAELNRGPTDISNPSSGPVGFGTIDDVLGPSDAFGNALNVLSLGDGGWITMTFDQPITNGLGADFAVFENGFLVSGELAFLEFAFVEVSSDGANFFRFDSISEIQTTNQTIGDGPALLQVSDASEVNNLAGKYIAGYGTPFDLEELVGIDPLLDVNAVTHVRIVDVVGSIDPAFGSLDSLDTIINDPFTTDFNTGGFDLDAVGVIHFVPEPASGSLLLGGGLALLALRRRRTGTAKE
ncbi:MAG: PEP-CTERM sorting domain-containing protein [Verrucomicrobiota bacterium]